MPGARTCALSAAWYRLPPPTFFLTCRAAQGRPGRTAATPAGGGEPAGGRRTTTGTHRTRCSVGGRVGCSQEGLRIGGPLLCCAALCVLCGPRRAAANRNIKEEGAGPPMRTPPFPPGCWVLGTHHAHDPGAAWMKPPDRRPAANGRGRQAKRAGQGSGALLPGRAPPLSAQPWYRRLLHRGRGL